MSATRDEVLRAMAEALCFSLHECTCCEGQCRMPSPVEEYGGNVTNILTAAAECGWKLVPREATETMAHEGLHAKLLSPGPRYHADNRAIWAAMLAAAPKVTP